MAFLDERYLLGNDTAAALFSEVEGLPVVDAHNHSDIKEIAVNANYKNAWQVVAATDHYVWEMMRKRGIPEEYITGEADPKEKWLKALEKVVKPQFLDMNLKAFDLGYGD